MATQYKFKESFASYDDLELVYIERNSKGKLRLVCWIDFVNGKDVFLCSEIVERDVADYKARKIDFRTFALKPKMYILGGKNMEAKEAELYLPNSGVYYGD